MPKTLLVTNDFPPVIGGIESYLRDFVSLLDPNEIIVFAPTRDQAACQSYDAQLRSEMGAAGREHVVKNWNWDLMGARLQKELREI